MWRWKYRFLLIVLIVLALAALWRCAKCLYSNTKHSPVYPEMTAQKVKYGILAAKYCVGKFNSITGCGEDAVGLTVSPQGILFASLADGVGGWTLRNITSSLLSYHIVKASVDHFTETGARDPHRVFASAYEKVKKIIPPLLGSCTYTGLCIDEGIMKCCNLGDSGFAIIRDKKFVHQSTEQQHTFNCPYQICPFLDDQPEVDTPPAADSYTFPVCQGDVIIAYTDGLSDNLFSKDVLSTLDSCGILEKTATQEMIDNASKRLVDLAVLTGQNTSAISPFAVKAWQHGFLHRGGKSDDTSVVIIKIVQLVE